jgi:hypothetical protein
MDEVLLINDLFVDVKLNPFELEIYLILCIFLLRFPLIFFIQFNVLNSSTYSLSLHN